MTAIAIRRPALPSGMLLELFERQRALASFGLALLAITVPVLALQEIDLRTLNGVSVWVKPAKFLFSIAIFSLTTAWFFGYVRPERRRARTMRAIVWAIIGAGTLELFYIGWQAAQGLDSHFNTGTPFHALMYGLMGVFAVTLVGTTLPLAWEIARRPVPRLSRDFVAAVVIGLVLTFLLGGGLGGYMSAQPGHSVGAHGGGMPIFGWNRSGGDLRIAHFFGIHAQQALPILAALVASFASPVRWRLLIGGTTLYVLVTLGVFLQAVAGRPFLAF